MNKNNKLDFYQKFVVIFGYIFFFTKWPYMSMFMVIFFKDDYIRMHMNRIIFMGFVNTAMFLLSRANIAIPYFSLNTFLCLFALIGLGQVLFESKHQLLITDRFKLVSYCDYVKVNTAIATCISIAILVISCVIRL